MDGSVCLLGVPGNGRAGQAGNFAALRSSSLGLVPQVLVERVGSSGSAVPLTADLSRSLLDCRWGSRGDGCQ